MNEHQREVLMRGLRSKFSVPLPTASLFTSLQAVIQHSLIVAHSEPGVIGSGHLDLRSACCPRLDPVDSPDGRLRLMTVVGRKRIVRTCVN